MLLYWTGQGIYQAPLNSLGRGVLSVKLCKCEYIFLQKPFMHCLARSPYPYQLIGTQPIYL